MKTQLGTWLSIGSSVIAEIAAEAGFDWLLFDLEHGCGDEAMLLPQFQATRGAKAKKIVRVGYPHADLILRALDFGADGLMVPRVNTVEDAEAIVQAAHYAPRGRRGVARTVRAHAYGLRPAPADQPPFEPFLLAQIETVEGVANAAAIAAVDGISALFIGPADLNYDLKARGSELAYDDCLKSVSESAAKAGKPCGILLRQPADLPKHEALGYRWIAIDSDIAILRESFVRLRNAVPVS